MPSGTLIKPPPIDPTKSAIENVLELMPLADIGPDIYTNARPLWHPPGARGIYGGAAIAQSLAAAQLTIPAPSPANNNAQFYVHSMHCYFVLAGDSEIPLLYHVERVREGKSFMTRTVQARQRGKCIFTTTLSFMRAGSGGKETVSHEVGIPEGMREELERGFKADEDEGSISDREAHGEEGNGPFEARRIEILNNSSPYPETKRTRQWIRARGKISSAGGVEAHLSALAYMSDSYFIGTVSRVHNLWRFAQPQRGNTSATTTPPKAKHPMAILEELENKKAQPSDRSIGMMVSLDHSIYFHRPWDLKADEWLFSEMGSPWAGDGRGLVLQQIWNRKGQLVASCVQEGLVRLKQKGDSKL